ncbi:MAG: ATP-binding cassette domain-containing protein [Rikenellaceae bacterium]|nr:ATP-binding cassette domain-containing protein [Rikenellaceae bacterium]
MDNEYYLELTECQPRIKELHFKEPINWQLKYGEVWAITGANGSGKTILGNIISGKIPISIGKIRYNVLSTTDKAPWQAVRMLTFDSVYGLANFRNSYYQQRWHSTENDDMPTVQDLLGTSLEPEILSIFGIDRMIDKKINFLSSGELRKFLLTKSLMEEPKILIIDNPYIGLDAESREVLTQTLKKLTYYAKTQLIFIFSSSEDIPDFVTHILPIQDMTVQEPISYNNFISQSNIILERADRICANEIQRKENIIELNNISVKYGTKVILNNFKWHIKTGERWVLTGGNGKGKSTILSLINADHPQAYSNDIKIFGKKRGSSGQSIWDVKKRIGYISPEMHTFYSQNISVLDVVASGLFDTIGSIWRYSDEQRAQCRKWLKLLDIEHLEEKSFTKISSGEQRLALLARTFVKEPEVLILDEPLHGLDTKNKIKIRNIIDEFVVSENTTLIYVSHYEKEFPGCITHILSL